VSLSANPVFEKVLLGDGYDQGFAFGRHRAYCTLANWLSAEVEF